MAERDRTRRITVGHERFKEWCDKSGLSRAELCEMINDHIDKHSYDTAPLKAKTLSQYYNGDRRPSPVKMLVIEDIAKIDPYMWSL